VPDDRRHGLVRVVAALAALATVLGIGLVLTAVLATRRLWFAGYVSEAGVATEPHVPAYQGGMFCLAVGLSLLGVAASTIAPVAAWLLAAAGALATVSGAVPCSAGCPLPPYEPATMADLVHGGASAMAVAACTLAMGALALRSSGGVAKLSRIAFWVVAPLVAMAALAMLTVGRGHATGLLERVILVASTAWILATSAALFRAPPR
jgi:hypothetical protein